MADDALTVESVLDEARSTTGLDDFGADDFRPGLAALLRTYDENAFSEKGRRRNRRRVIQLLATRLRVEAAFRSYPEIRERKIVRPMVLTGLPRSGTSALFNLLAIDAAARPLRLWETQFPEPREDWSEATRGAPDPRRDAIEAHYAKGREKNPDFTKIHYTSADTPEECVLLHAYALNGVQMGIEVMMEPYGSWYRAQDLRPMYAYQRDLLKMLDWQRPGQRWLLKAPAHMWGIDALIETFPDVAIVWSHRNPLACVASICSMTHALGATRENVDKRELGTAVLDFYATSLERGLAARDAADPARFVDVTHDAFVDDSLAIVERIYAHFDLPLDADSRRAMREHVDANPKGKHGSHDYGVEEYGLSPADMLERFGPYVERFGIAVD